MHKKILWSIATVKNLFSYSPIHLFTSKRKSVAFTLAGATHVALPKNNRKAAFTLAEVLITLGIIGVVAAITLPVLTSKINRLVLNQQFKKAYSVLSNAVNSTIFDMAEDTDCFYYERNAGGSDKISSCYSFWSENFIKKLKIVKICEGNAYEQGCVPDYSWPDPAGCAYFTTDNIKNNAYVAVTADGMIILPFTYTPSKSAYPILAFDVNGKKGPNMPGVDVYSLNIFKRANNTFFFGGTSYSYGGDGVHHDYTASCLYIANPHSDALFEFSEIMK